MNGNQMSDEDTFWRLLAEASSTPSCSPLRSNEALAAFLKANPLTPAEEEEVAAAVDRLRARLRGRKPIVREEHAVADSLEMLSEAERLVLNRNQGKSNPEIEKRLEELRNKIREEMEKRKLRRPEPPPSEADRAP
jgi:hypothetical protein